MARQAKKTTARSTGKSRMTKARKGRKPVPENETKHDRFIRLATKRMNNAIRQIQLLGNLCSPNYECDANDLALMRDAISRELDSAIARFSPRRRQEQGKPAFTFGSEAKAALSGNTQH